MTAPEIPHALSRRRLLKGGLWGGVLVALSGVGLSLQKTKQPSSLPASSVLTPEEYAVLVAIADTLCPRRRAQPSASDLGVPQKAEALFALADHDQLQGLKVALHVVEHPLTGALFG